MSERDSFPDEVPVPDAAEQDRPLNESGDDAEAPQPDPGFAAAPLEADSSDWHEQHVVVDIDDEDFR